MRREFFSLSNHQAKKQTNKQKDMTVSVNIERIPS